MAVFTEVSDESLHRFLTEYDIGEATSCQGIAEGVENSNFSLRTTAGHFILTLYEKRVDTTDLPYFLGLMDHLAGRGVVCPRPVAGRDGRALRALCGRAASITTFLPGASPRVVETGYCGAVGRALATLHRAGADYAPTRSNALGPEGWRPLLARARDHADSATLPAALLDELRDSLDSILAAWPRTDDRRALPLGHIHADLFPDNVFFQNGEVSGLIDFYFAATDLLAYDVAVCLNAWCFDSDLAFDRDRSRAMLDAYQAACPMTPQEIAALPVLCAGAAIRFVLTRLYDSLATPPGALVVRKDPMEYVHRLRFHRTVTDAATYGA